MTMATSKEELRASVIQYVEKVFADKLDSVESLKNSEIGDDIRVKFEQTFVNYLTTAFDVVFKQELNAQEAAAEADKWTGNLSVNDEQLQEMDDAVTAACSKRKAFPAKCSLLLDKILKLQLDSALKIKSKVHTLDPFEIEAKPIDASQMEDEIKELTSKSRQVSNKALKVKRSANMLAETLE